MPVRPHFSFIFLPLPGELSRVAVVYFFEEACDIFPGPMPRAFHPASFPYYVLVLGRNVSECARG